MKEIEVEPEVSPLNGDVLCFRGEIVESAHRLSVAVVDEESHLLYKLGDPSLLTTLRSAAKPFQMIPLLMALEENEKKLEFTSKEIAVMVGSHSGTEKHVETVLSILEKVGLDEDALKCGRHPPFHKETKKMLGENYRQIHNNCSGKHAGLLALCVLKGYDTEGYLNPSHPIQKKIKETVSLICNYPEALIYTAIDGCGVPVFFLPIYAMASGWARFVSEKELTGNEMVIKKETREKVIRAMVSHPEMVAGTERLDTELMKLANKDKEKLISKAGAEGLGTVGLLKKKMGVVVKVEDGSNRAIGPGVIHTLLKINVLSEEEVELLKKYYMPEIKNRRGEVVGRIKPNFNLISV